MKTPVKVLETLKILLGISLPFTLIWGLVLPFDPNKMISIVDLIIAIIGTAAGALVGGPAIVRQTLGRFTGHYVTRADGEKVA